MDKKILKKEVERLLKILGYKLVQSTNKKEYDCLTFERKNSLLLDVYFSKLKQEIFFEISDFEKTFFCEKSNYDINNLIEIISKLD